MQKHFSAQPVLHATAADGNRRLGGTLDLEAQA